MHESHLMENNKKILIIEDNQEFSEKLRELLELSNYEVILASTGKEGWERALREHPDLILCKTIIPELDGYGLLHLMIKDDRTADIPFVMLAPRADISDMRRGMEMGADDYIVKPFENSDLLKVIETRLNKRDRLLHPSTTHPALGSSAFLHQARGQVLLENLLRNREGKHWGKRQTIYREGDYPKWVYYLREGHVKLYASNEDGKELLLSVANPGDWFGYKNLVNDQPYTETAETIANAETLSISRDEFLSLLQGNNDISNALVKNLAAGVVIREAEMMNLAYNSVRRRIAKALLSLRNKTTCTKMTCIDIFRNDIAHLAGTALETVIRTLKDFEAEGLIKLKGRRIDLLRPDKLETMPN